MVENTDVTNVMKTSYLNNLPHQTHHGSSVHVSYLTKLCHVEKEVVLAVGEDLRRPEHRTGVTENIEVTDIFRKMTHLNTRTSQNSP